MTLDPTLLRGLEPEVAQVWGRVRLVPLIRKRVRGDLRIGLRRYDDDFGIVDLGGRPGGSSAGAYYSYIPHGLVVGWSKDGAQVAGDTVLEHHDERHPTRALRAYGVRHRMIKRERRGAQSRLRLLPLHVAMEAYLGLHFGGPDIAWDVYSERVLRRGLTPRVEWTTPGYALPDLHAALRLFEIHEGQCGVLIFVGGRFASATIVSHPADYRRMHRAVVDDFYGRMLAWASWYAPAAEPAPVRLDARAVEDWNTLGVQLRAARDAWARVEVGFAQSLFGRAPQTQTIYRMAPFDLVRFDTGYVPGEANHIGEAIVRDDGTLEYLKTYHLSRGQTERGFLLCHLAAHRWHLGDAAAARRQTVAHFVAALERAQLGWILRGAVRDRYRR